jgi:hypothetical protein
MIFGGVIALAGFYLAATAKAGSGQTTFSVLGAEISLAAAGGILVMLLGVVTFALPTLMVSIRKETSPTPARTIIAPMESDIGIPTDDNGRRLLLATGPRRPQEIAAYLALFAEDKPQDQIIGGTGAHLSEALSNKRSIDLSYFWYEKPSDSQFKTAQHAIQERLCNATHLARATSLGGSVHVSYEYTTLPDGDTHSMTGYYLECK